MSPLLRFPLLRLARAPRAWLGALAATSLAIIAALVGRAHTIAHGADHALLDVYATVALPLLVYVVVAAFVAGEGLATSIVPLVSLGASRARVALFTLLVAVFVSALLGGAAAAGVAAIAHGTSDPPFTRDVATSLEIGALGGAAYASFFMFGASFGARGWGRSVLLVVDWIFGAGVGTSAVLTPRAHLRSLLGGSAPLDLSSRASFIALVLLALACGALAVRRASSAEWKLPRGARAAPASRA